MISIPLQNASDSKITVTDTATSLYSLIDTASSVSNSQKYYDSRFAGALSIMAEDGDIRWLEGATPTSTEGNLIKMGQKEWLPGVVLSEIKLIRAGTSDVAVTVVPCRGEPKDSPALMGGIFSIGDGTNLADVIQNADDDSTPEDKYGLVTSSVLYGRTSGTDIRPLRIDSITNTLQTIDYEHHEIHEGSHYMVCGAQDLAINHVLDVTFQTPDTTSWSHLTWKISTESETQWYIYEDAVVTNPLANSITPYNNNRNSANTSGNTLKYEEQANLAAANADTDVSGATLLESGISGAGKDGGIADRNQEIILKQNTIYCMRAIATSAGYISYCMEWYEHQNKS